MATEDVLRKNRGLGMLLANIASNKDTEATSSEIARTAPKKAPEKNQGFDPNEADFEGWGDVSSKSGGNSNMNAEKNDNGPGNDNVKPEGRKNKGFLDEDVYGPMTMNRWADIKEYDDDHDSQWFEEENARLAEKYGGKFIYAKYLDSQPGRIGYYCQLCSAEMNARKSLDLHCSGMKHLKRKDQFEKEGKGEDDGGDSSNWPDRPRQPNRRNMKEPYHPPPRPWSDREPPRRDSFGGPRPFQRGPPSPGYRMDDRPPFGRRDDYDFGRSQDNFYDNDFYRNDPMPYGPPPFERDSFDGRRTPPDMRNDFDYPPGPGPSRREHGDRFSQERFTPYGRRKAPPPPVISGPQHFDGPPGQLFDGISDGSCNELLKKLSVCRVKNPEDTALATNVASFLIMSLRDYFSKVGPATIVHLLDEVIVKMDIMRNLMK